MDYQCRSSSSANTAETALRTDVLKFDNMGTYYVNLLDSGSNKLARGEMTRREQKETMQNMYYG